MTAASASEAVANANRYSTCEPGMCLQYTRTWLEIASLYGSAIDAWHGASVRHNGRDAPTGAPVFYKGGQHGHIALSVGGGKVRTTDRPSSGKVSTVALADIENAWGYPYLGWTEDLNGTAIPWLGEDDDVGHVDSIGTEALQDVGRYVWESAGQNPAGTLSYQRQMFARFDAIDAAIADLRADLDALRGVG